MKLTIYSHIHDYFYWKIPNNISPLLCVPSNNVLFDVELPKIPIQKIN